MKGYNRIRYNALRYYLVKRKMSVGKLAQNVGLRERTVRAIMFEDQSILENPWLQRSIAEALFVHVSDIFDNEGIVHDYNYCCDDMREKAGK